MNSDHILNIFNDKKEKDKPMKTSKTDKMIIEFMKEVLENHGTGYAGY